MDIGPIQRNVKRMEKWIDHALSIVAKHVGTKL
jgi:hypothetical protein